MGKRRKARESAMQALFYMDITGDASAERFSMFVDCFTPDGDTFPFFQKLVQGVLEVRPSLDRFIERFSSHWKINRMACVDRNILRLAVFELLFCEDIPPKVSINEAIDVGKKYGTDESGAFINGILDSVRIAMEAGEITVGDIAGNLQPTNKE